MPTETKFLSYKMPIEPKEVKQPESVYLDEETKQYRFKPFEEIDRKYVEFVEKSSALKQQIEDVRTALEQAKAEYQVLLTRNVNGDISDEELMASRQSIKEQERLLIDKEAMISEKISRMTPSYDKAALHKQYHDEYIAYMRYLNNQEVYHLLKTRIEYVQKIEKTFDEFSRSIDVRKDAKRLISDLRMNGANQVIQSPVPTSLQLGITQYELDALKDHDSLKNYE